MKSLEFYLHKIRKTSRTLFKFCPLLIGSLVATNVAKAWDVHGLLTEYILQGSPELSQANIKAESLSAFVKAEHAKLRTLLQTEEAWLVKNLSYYPKTPTNLLFTAENTDPNLTAKFISALRINPQLKYPLFLRLLPGAALPNIPTSSYLANSDVSIVKLTEPEKSFYKLEEGQAVSPHEIITTAVDEPDYGIDVGLFEDNETEFGKAYGFGVQPYGNNKLDYGTQAPFHMGFYHESPFIYILASYSKKSTLEYRVHLYTTLAKFAFANNHPYWGFRFTGWALHYIQDIFMPFHSKMTPGIGLTKLIYASMPWYSNFKTGLLNILTTQHTVFETYIRESLTPLLQNHINEGIIYTALKNSAEVPDKNIYSNPKFVQIISKEPAANADKAVKILTSVFPQKYIKNPNYIFGVTEPAFNLVEYLQKNNSNIIPIFDAFYLPILMKVSGNTKYFIKYAQTTP